MLVIVSPIAFVASLLLSGINPEPIGFVVHPIAIVNVTTGMVELPSAACLVVLPGAFVSPRIWPRHFAPAVPHPSFPLAGVDRSSLVCVRASPELCIRLVSVVRESLLCLFLLEIPLSALAVNFLHLEPASGEEAPDQGLDSYQRQHVVDAYSLVAVGR